MELRLVIKRKCIAVSQLNAPDWLRPFVHFNEFLGFENQWHLPDRHFVREVSSELPTFLGSRCTDFSHDIPDEFSNGSSFSISGYWVPIDHGTFFHAPQDFVPHPCFRLTDHGPEILFVVHPLSEGLFAPLISQFHDQKVDLEAVHTSSLRSLVIKVPSPDCEDYSIVMAKVSLMGHCGKRLRVLDLKECASSVTHSTVALLNPHPAIKVITEPFSFVPSAELICHDVIEDPKYSEASRFGIIFRELPSELLSLEPQSTMIPFFALLSHPTLLSEMVSRSGLSATEFITQYFINPLADLISDGFNQHVFFELHTQNLIVVRDKTTGLPSGFTYRDCAGISVKDSEYYDSHTADMGNALENYLVGNVLFGLTKWVVHHHFKVKGQSDPAFLDWIRHQGQYMGNWYDYHSDMSLHVSPIADTKFRQYGFFEQLFAEKVVSKLKELGVTDAVLTAYPNMTPYFNPIVNLGEINVHSTWFSTYLSSLYSYYLHSKS